MTKSHGNASDDGLVGVSDRLDHPPQDARSKHRAAHAITAHFPDVGSGRKIAPSAAQDDHSNVIVVLEHLEDALEILSHW